MKNIEKRITNEEIKSEWIKRTRVQGSVLQTLVWSLLSYRILHHHDTACPSKKGSNKTRRNRLTLLLSGNMHSVKYNTAFLNYTVNTI